LDALQPVLAWQALCPGVREAAHIPPHHGVGVAVRWAGPAEAQGAITPSGLSSTFAGEANDVYA
jgi:hypothetical protein